MEKQKSGKHTGKSDLLILDVQRRDSPLAKKYVVIDSFLSPATKNPIAIEYLNSIGLDSGNIIGVICSHWDDDHIRGLSDIAASIKGLNVGIPATFSQRELSKLREYLSYVRGAFDHVSINEFTRLMELYDNNMISFNFCLPHRKLFNHLITAEGLNDIDVEVLSPSDKAYSQFIDQLVIPKEGDLMQSINFSNNSISVVSVFNLKGRYCLFGGDLENGHGEWNEIINQYHYPKAEIFKIPHHGSENGYSEKVWEKIVDNPISIITRFNRGRVFLPEDKQVRIIHNNSSKVFVVGGKSVSANESKHKLLEGLVSQEPHQMVRRKEKLGIIRLSYDTNDWRFETFGEVEELPSQEKVSSD